MTGFRGCFGGVSKISGVEPDLTCLGKVVGGGMPLAVYGGRAEIMAQIAPDGPVYQAGTLSGNPVAVASGIATLTRICQDKDFYPNLLTLAEKLETGLARLALKNGFAVNSNRYGSMMTMFFNPNPVKNYQDAAKSDTGLFARWFRAMLEQGVYLAPSQFEAAFVSAAHTQTDIENTLSAADLAFQKMKSI
jgi:glutamate-1-semialdehyde 2,1-aminomutase